MIYLKKLTFAPIFLIILAFTCYKLTSLIGNSQLLFTLDWDTLITLVSATLLIIGTSLSFVLFTAIANDIRIVPPIIVIGALLPLILFPSPLNFFMAGGLLICLIISFLTVQNQLQTYLNFQPTQLFTPPTRQLTGFIILLVCFIYFLSVSQSLGSQGFQIPDSLLDTVLKFTPGINATTDQSSTTPTLPQITPEQLNLLKQNPDLLKQAGLDPKMLDSLTNPSSSKSQNSSGISANDLIKTTIKQQLQSMIKPYTSYIPAALAVFLYLTLLPFSSLGSIIIAPIFWLVFLILEAVGFVSFTTEMRQVKKLVV